MGKVLPVPHEEEKWKSQNLPGNDKPKAKRNSPPLPRDSTAGLPWLQPLRFNPFQAVCFDFGCWGGLHDMLVQDGNPCLSHTHPN